MLPICSTMKFKLTFFTRLVILYTFSFIEVAGQEAPKYLDATEPPPLNL